MSDWVEEFVTRLETAVNGVLTAKIGGVEVAAVISDDLTEFFKKNKPLLRRVGKETFRSFLLLLHEKKDEQAFNLLLAKMDAEDIILRMEMNADALKEFNDLRKEFLESLKKFAVTTLTSVLGKVLVALIV